MPTNPQAASLRRAQRESLRLLSRRLRVFQPQLRERYQSLGLAIAAAIQSAADADGLLGPLAGPGLRAQIDALVDSHGTGVEVLMRAWTRESVALGAEVFAGAAAVAGVDVAAAASTALAALWGNATAGGLVLSQRLWVRHEEMRAAAFAAINDAINAGRSVGAIAQDLALRGVPLPDDLVALRGRASAQGIALRLRNDIDGGIHYRNLLRIARSEVVRAHGLAHRAAVSADPGAAGVRYTLSPRHPSPDICDMHSSVNLYGLGKGVYPPDKSPWPAHPNILSYEQVVYLDEITDDDRAGRETRLEWLATQSPSVQRGVIGGGEAKYRAYLDGHVTERSITTPWRVLRQRLQRQGVDISRYEQ